MDVYEIWVGVSRGGPPDAPRWWCAVSRQGHAPHELATELTGALSTRRALWQALRRGFAAVPDGAPARVIVDRLHLAAARHLARLMLGDQPRIKVEVAAAPETTPAPRTRAGTGAAPA